MNINQAIVISDQHAGCQFGLCPSGGITLDGGGRYIPSKLQQIMYEWWRLFWDEWVPSVTRDEPYAIVLNGDVTDGRHHDSTTQISQNLADQQNIALELISPLVDMAANLPGGGKAFYMIRGTEAHVGPSGENEERIAEALGAVPDEVGNHARYELWCKLGGENGCLVHFNHHIGTTGRTHYETSAVMAELGEAFAEAGRWGHQAPDIIIRSHRHRHTKVEVPTIRGSGIAEVTPGWQLKTPFVYKIPGGRNSTPQCGGILVRQGDEDAYTRHKVWNITRSAPEVL